MAIGLGIKDMGRGFNLGVKTMSVWGNG